jgi:hypothetical protein
LKASLDWQKGSKSQKGCSETGIGEGRIILASALYGKVSKVSRQQIPDAHLGVRSLRLQIMKQYEAVEHNF